MAQGQSSVEGGVADASSGTCCGSVEWIAACIGGSEGITSELAAAGDHPDELTQRAGCLDCASADDAVSRGAMSM